ncbi:G-protein coupled receptor Mth2 [Ooceraea biroi]|uniref:G-protein coupled receptor Mth2 n=1 Tax=Ooceraea biroi TaxID=2015173 RepID=A0A026WVG1_OOCBI|nr:G-protein coupled receptor Mth2 [Ooceraea biroi]
MYASGPSCYVALVLLCFASSVFGRPTTGVVYRTDRPRKCCDIGYAFNEDLECVHVDPDRINYTTFDAWRTLSSQRSRQATVISSVQGLNCRVHGAGWYPVRHPSRVPRLRVSRDYCVENMINGTAVLAECPSQEISVTPDTGSSAESMVVTRTTTTTTTIVTVTTITTTITTRMMINDVSSSNVSSNTSSNLTDGDHREVYRHSNGLSTVYFWGAQTYMDTNLAHVVLCSIVVAVYLLARDLGKSIYNRAVLRHNVCLLLQGCILLFFGYCDICDCLINVDVAVFLWIVQQYFTNATVFWLNVICIDMTLSITRFRWLVGSGQRTVQEENRRFLLYGAFAWGGAFIPALFAFVLEFYPGIPEDFPLKPNYRRYRGGPNFMVIIYFFSLPLLLFVFTTYKIVRIQRSTEIATRNQTNALRKKYFLFLQMYLLMGAPWFFGLLLACMNKLVVLKICRLIWPIIWLLMLATQKKLLRRVMNKLRCVMKTREASTTNS